MPYEIEISRDVIAAIAQTAVVGVVWWFAVSAITFVAALALTHRDPKPPEWLKTGCVVVAPAFGVVGMVLYHTVRIVWVP